MDYSNSKGLLSDYAQLNTLPALSGVLFAISSGVQFLGVSISMTIPWAYTFDPSHGLVVSLVVMVIAFASSSTKDWRQYESYEQGAVALAVILMVGNEYLIEVSDLIVNNNPTAGTLAFLVTVVAWGILAR